MATILDNFTDNLKTWTNSAANRASELTKAAANKAEELGKVGRLKMEVFQLQRQRQRFLGDLGAVAYGLIKNKTAPDALAKNNGVENLMRRLIEVNARIDLKNAEIEAASALRETQKRKLAPAKAIAVAPAATTAKTKSRSAGGGKAAKPKTGKVKTGVKKSTPKATAKSSKAAAKKSKPSAKSKS